MSGGRRVQVTGDGVMGGRNFPLLLTYCCCGNKLFVKVKMTLAN